MIPSTSVTISRAYGSLLSSLRSARSVLYFLIDDRDAAGDQSARRVGFHDHSVTIVVASHIGAKERLCSWIPRSPTRTKRESSNAKFHGPWHERVIVIGFGLLTCMMFTRLIFNPTTAVSTGNKTALSRLFLYLPANSTFFSLLPRNKQKPDAIETGQRIIPRSINPFSRWLTKASRPDPFKIKAKSSSLPGRMHRWFDPTPTSSFFRVSFLPILGRSCCHN